MRISMKKPLILEIIDTLYRSDDSIEYRYWITNTFLENFIFIFRRFSSFECTILLRSPLEDISKKYYNFRFE